MNFKEILWEAWRALGAHKLRAFLTTLGIVFGVAAVIAMLSIGEGAKKEALEAIKLLGTNNLLVKAAPVKEKAGADVGGRSAGLSLKDAANFERLTGLVTLVVPERSEKVKEAFFQDKESEIELVATTPEYPAAFNLQLASGRFFSYLDAAETRRVCVLGGEIKKELFGFENPTGQKVKLGSDYFTVIGSFAPQALTQSKVEGLEAKNVNRMVFIPLKTAQLTYDRKPDDANVIRMGGVTIWTSGRPGTVSELDLVTVKVADGPPVEKVAAILENMLARRHNGVKDYQIVIPEALLRQSQKTQRIFNIVMGTIAGISLLVGGIGIMNIMLASVLERFREIGVRRAVGAKQKDILYQFLIEAVGISLLGCTAGVLLGFLLSKSVTYYAGWKTIFSWPSVVIAVGVAAAVGLSFGIYPARRAAKLDPIDALRYE